MLGQQGDQIISNFYRVNVYPSWNILQKEISIGWATLDFEAVELFLCVETEKITPKYAVHMATWSNTRVVLFNAAEKNNPTFFEPVNNSGIGVLLHKGCYCVPYMKVHICVGIFNSFLGKVLKGL